MGALRVFGIRHHGPGSARSLQRALESYAPDALLIEGPPEADEVIALAGHAEMKPPVALLVYVPEDPQQAASYPFAAFSPEWLAIQYGLQAGIVVRFMDLPVSHRLAMSAAADALADGSRAAAAPAPARTQPLEQDPLGALAELAGFPDGERWWDSLIESRSGAHVAVFEAIADAMATLRAGRPATAGDFEAEREAYMRKTIREALKDGAERVAVVCGAWHVPALVDPHAKGCATADSALLKGLPKVKTAVAWTPWSYDRLSFRSGYGAGVRSPAYYHLLWTHAHAPAVHWLTRAARLMRRQDLDASSAHIIEAVRLAEALAALRGRPLPGLEELNESALTVLCGGAEAPLRLIQRKLIIGDRLGAVPTVAPQIPLQVDLQKLQKKLRLPASADEKDYDLDLRKPLDLERSHLLHRLNLLGVPWGDRRAHHTGKGTFHEVWRVQWKPEFAIDLISAGRWGNTVGGAAAAHVRERAASAANLTELSALVDIALLADLPKAVGTLLQALQDRAAVAGDTLQLMAALPALAGVSRYGNVRQTDRSAVLTVVDGLVARISVGLSAATASLNDEAAQQVFDLIGGVHQSIALLDRAEHHGQWRPALEALADGPNRHGLLAGQATRLLHDAGEWEAERVGRQLHLALSRAADAVKAALWVEGFLRGSGQVLLHDQTIWGLLDDWLTQLSEEHFLAALPLLRRTFATFAPAERRQMGARVLRGRAAVRAASTATDFDYELAGRVVPLLAVILGANHGDSRTESET